MSRPKREWVTLKYHWPDGKVATMKVDPALVWTVARALMVNHPVYEVTVHSPLGTFEVQSGGGVQVLESDYYQGSYLPNTQIAL